MLYPLSYGGSHHGARLGSRLRHELEVEERIEVGSGEELWNWCLGGNPIPGMLTAALTEEQKATVRQVRYGMLRERCGGDWPAVLTAPLNIGIGLT